MPQRKPSGEPEPQYDGPSDRFHDRNSPTEREKIIARANRKVLRMLDRINDSFGVNDTIDEREAFRQAERNNRYGDDDIGGIPTMIDIS